MPKLLARSVALVLVPCLLMDPLFASAFQPAQLRPNQNFPKQSIYSSQALSAMSLTSLRIRLLSLFANRMPMFYRMLTNPQGMVPSQFNPIFNPDSLELRLYMAVQALPTLDFQQRSARPEFFQWMALIEEAAASEPAMPVQIKRSAVGLFPQQMQFLRHLNALRLPQTIHGKILYAHMAMLIARLDHSALNRVQAALEDAIRLTETRDHIAPTDNNILKSLIQRHSLAGSDDAVPQRHELVDPENALALLRFLFLMRKAEPPFQQAALQHMTQQLFPKFIYQSLLVSEPIELTPLQLEALNWVSVGSVRIALRQEPPLQSVRRSPTSARGFTLAETLTGVSILAAGVAGISYLFSVFSMLSQEVQELLGGGLIIVVSTAVVLAPIWLMVGGRQIVEGFADSGKNDLPITDPRHPNYKKNDGFLFIGPILTMAVVFFGGFLAAPWLASIDFSPIQEFVKSPTNTLHLTGLLGTIIVGGIGVTQKTQAPKPRVLIVDDDFIVVEVLRRILEGTGYTAVTAYDGQEAIERFQQEGPFDLVILDGQMPRLDGLEAAQFIRAANDTVPILFTSGSSYLNERAESIPHVRIYPKPYDYDPLLVIVKQLAPLQKEEGGDIVDFLGFTRVYQKISHGLSRYSISPPRIRRLMRTAA
jgi:CheY-like chemotaxis protein